MIERLDKKYQRGTILILALWSLGLLSVFAIYLGVAVRGKIKLQSRLEQRDKLYFLAESGVKKAIAVLNNDLILNEYAFTAEAKQARHNNPGYFSEIRLGEGTVDISYEYFQDSILEAQTRYGLTDEESKIDINLADLSTLQRLIKYALNWEDQQASQLAQAIFDWKEYGRSELVGFYGDEYYENLQYPYASKDTPFETIDELLLVKGVTREILGKLKPFMTIYSNNAININTASRITLLAVGFKETLVDKILQVRRGPDGLEASGDDFVFESSESVNLDLQRFVPLEGIELYQLQEMLKRGGLATNSSHYTVRARAALKGEERRVITCVFDVIRSKIVYWREEELSPDPTPRRLRDTGV